MRIESPIFYGVYPCAQWFKEYPNEPKVLYWWSKKFAHQSAYDTGGFVIAFHHEPVGINVREY